MFKVGQRIFVIDYKCEPRNAFATVIKIWQDSVNGNTLYTIGYDDGGFRSYYHHKLNAILA